MRACLVWGAILGLGLGPGDFDLRATWGATSDESRDNDSQKNAYKPPQKPPTPQPKPPTPSQPPPKPPVPPPHPQPKPAPAHPTRPPSGNPGHSHPPSITYYNPYWYDAYPYPNSSYYPPLYLSGDTMFGPQSIQRFLGADSGGGGTGFLDNRTADLRANEVRPARSTSPELVSRAQRFIGYGDTHFSNEKYVDAYDRYRSAQQTTPNLGVPYFRQGFALIALGRYDAAAKAFKRGLQVEPEWPTSGFSLDQLYGAKQTLKNKHLDAIAAAAASDPSNADLLLLIGVCLWCDGKQERARVFFQRSVQLALDPIASRAFLNVAK